MENKRKKFGDYIYWLSFVLMLLSIGVLIGYLYNNYQGEILGFISNIQQESFEEGDISLGCENLSLFESVDCLVKNVKPFYKYNHTEGNIPLTLKEIKEFGGDCWDYIYLYSGAVEELGFGYRYLKYPMNEKEMHIFLIIYNEEGYCLVDGISSVCASVESQIGE